MLQDLVKSRNREIFKSFNSASVLREYLQVLESREIEISKGNTFKTFSIQKWGKVKSRFLKTIQSGHWKTHLFSPFGSWPITVRKYYEWNTDFVELLLYMNLDSLMFSSQSSVAFTAYETSLMNSITEGSLVLILRTTTSFNLNWLIIKVTVFQRNSI